jgi:hypothetical protein
MLDIIPILFILGSLLWIARQWLGKQFSGLGWGSATSSCAVPFIGSSLTSTLVFARYGCDYLAWAAATSGGDFAVSLLFQTYIFLNSKDSVRAFSRASPQVLALQPAVQHFTQKNFGLPPELWEDGEAKPAHILRKLLAPARLPALHTQLCGSLLRLHGKYFSNQKVRTDSLQLSFLQRGTPTEDSLAG